MAPSEAIRQALTDAFGANLSSLVALFVPAPDLSFERGVELLKKAYRVHRKVDGLTYMFEESLDGMASMKIEVDGMRYWEDTQYLLYPYPEIGSVPREQRIEWTNSLFEDLDVQFTAKQGDSYVSVQGNDPFVYDKWYDRYYVILKVTRERELRGR